MVTEAFKKQIDRIRIDLNTNRAICTREIVYTNNQDVRLERLPIREKFPLFTEQNCFIRETVKGIIKDRPSTITASDRDTKLLTEISKVGYLDPNEKHVITIEYEICPLGEKLVNGNDSNDFKSFYWEVVPAVVLDYKLIFEAYEESMIASDIKSKLKNLIPKRYEKKIQIYSNKTDIPDEKGKNFIRRTFKMDALSPNGPYYKVKCNYGYIYVPSRFNNFLMSFIPGFIIGLVSGLSANIVYSYLNKFWRI